MRIHILAENLAREKLIQAEWGVSICVDTEQGRILFDSGASDLFLRNASRMNLNPEQAEHLVLSHRHWDHAGGFLVWKPQIRPRLHTHPDSLANMTEAEKQHLETYYQLQLTTTPATVIPGITFLGEIPRVTDFEPGDWKGDPMLDDSAILLQEKGRNHLITGCSHSGICNIIQYATEVAGGPVNSVLGGFHLFETFGDRVEKTVRWIRNYMDRYPQEEVDIFPMHCIDLPSINRFFQAFGVKRLGAGSVIEL